MGNLDEARHALEGASRRVAREAASSSSPCEPFVECLSQEPSAAAAVRDHLVRLVRLAEEARLPHALEIGAAAIPKISP